MKNKSLKKLFILMFITLGAFLTPFIKAAPLDTKEVHFHYYRFDDTYAPWDMWIWQSKPTSEGGVSYAFEEDSDPYSFGGKKVVVKLEGALSNASELGFIVRKPDWSEKDIDNDRFISIKDQSENGIQHVYLVQGDPLIGSSLTDPDGPSKLAKFTSAYFIEDTKLFFRATEKLTQDKVKILKDDIELTFAFEEKGNGYVITLNETIDFSKVYTIEGVFSDDSINTLTVTYDGIYDSSSFDEAYYYDGELGVIIHEDKTTFRLWAPISKNVTLNLYDSGTTTQDGGSTDTPKSTHPMTKGIKGTWEVSFDENLHNTYYTYSVTNGSVTHEVVDPYAVSSGVNGRRGLVVDFGQVNPEGFKYNDRANNITNHTDAIIYELHVRDLSMHESWNGSDENRGKFLGLIETGTSYQNLTTGFDHIKDLGITHIQLIPIFDFGVVDETKLDDKTYNAFNWGYMPLHFNVPEGSYSSNPYDGLTRVKELKQVVMAYTENNIRLNMDVVYNHTGLSADSNFNLILPGYYHRKTDQGAFSNGSGTGNETASERSMMRKFMIDSLLMWTKEYNISGYRFDLMALHDIDTMNQVYDALTEIDPTIMVYGEPWMGGSSPLSASMQAGKVNLHLMQGVGAFNDDFRDAMKGSVFNKEDAGFIQGVYGAQKINRVKYGVVGGVSHEQVNPSLLSHQKAWHTEPGKTINYVTAHDNNTLHDKLYQTNESTNQLNVIDKMLMQAYSVLLTSQGVSFIHAGDEILRSKPAKDGNGFDHNSYESPDSVNQIRWDQKEKYTHVHNHIKGLIDIKKHYPELRLNTKEAIQSNVSFLYEEYDYVLVYTVHGENNLLIIHNTNTNPIKVVLPGSKGYDLISNQKQSGLDTIERYLAGEPVTLKPHESIIMVENQSSEKYQGKLPKTPISIITKSSSPSYLWWVIGGVVVTLGIGASLFLFKKKKI
ncbi:MAG: type I pullulanase [Acholeplasmataceae bacterium]